MITIDVFTLALCTLAALAIGYGFGHLHGFTRGKAYGWQEGYFGKVRDDRERRDHFGRFKQRHAPNHEWRARG